MKDVKDENMIILDKIYIEIYTEKRKSYVAKELIVVNDVNLVHMLISNNYSLGKYFKYFIGFVNLWSYKTITY